MSQTHTTTARPTATPATPVAPATAGTRPTLRERLSARRARRARNRAFSREVTSLPVPGGVGIVIPR